MLYSRVITSTSGGDPIEGITTIVCELVDNLQVSACL